MKNLEAIPIQERICDLCNDPVTNEDHTVVRSFLLADWGVICIECWDHRIGYRAGFKVVRAYVKSTIVEDAWVRRPLSFLTFSQ